MSLKPSLSKSAKSGAQLQSVEDTPAKREISLKVGIFSPVVTPEFNCNVFCMNWYWKPILSIFSNITGSMLAILAFDLLLDSASISI